MLIQSSLPISVESTPFHVSDHGKQNLFFDSMPGTEIWQMCPKCHDHCHNCCKEAASITEEKESNNYSCPLSFARSPHPPTISKMSESSAPNFVYSRRKLQGNTIGFLSAITKRSVEDGLYVFSSDGPSVPVKEHRVVSEDEHETEAVIPLMPPIVCNGAEYSRPSSFGTSTQLTTVSSVSESAAPNFFYGRTKLRQNSVSFLSAKAKRSGEDCPSVISSDGPSAAQKEQCLISIHEHRASLMPCPPVHNRADSPCPLSLQRSPHLPTVSTMSENSARNFVYSRKKLRRNSATFLSAQVPTIAKRRREDCLSVISSDGPSAACKEQHLISQHKHGAALMPPPTVYNRDDSPWQASLQRSPQLPTASTVAEISARNFVYSRRKLRGNSVTFLSAQVPGITKRSGEDCVSIISSDGPSLAVEEARVVSLDQHESGTGGALPSPPLVCNGERYVSKSESSSGCSLIEDLVSNEASKRSRSKIIEVDSINDSCSSSKSNMELVSPSTKSEGDDNGECSSSSVIAAEVAGEDQSEKDQGISILRWRGAFEGVWPGKTRASAKRINDGSGSSSSQSCKKCFRKESPVKMLICDNCEDSFHVSCCNPRVKRIPVDEWLCWSCLKKKRIIPKDTISRKPLNIIGEMGRCRDASSTGESNPIALMLRDTELYKGGVRVGKGFQVEVPDWSGPIINDVDTIGKPVVLDPSYFVILHELKSNKPSKLGSIGNWLQCRQVIDDAAEGGNVTICGKWRRAPLFEVQTEDWECFCCVFWDPIHADCAAPQELETDEVMKQLKYIQMLRPRIAAKRRKLKCANNGDPMDDCEE